MSNPADITSHYHADSIFENILNALRKMGIDSNYISASDLAAVDEFHLRGKEATEQLASRGGLNARMKVLDVGCGLGGSARFLANQFGCHVTGIDLTQSYVDVAQELTRLVNMDSQVDVVQGSALSLPFDDAQFDAVWTEHVQMNIADKRAFYSEIKRVLKPGGQLLFHDIFSHGQSPLEYPVPWASEANISQLCSVAEVQQVLQTLEFTSSQWHDLTQASIDWLEKMRQRNKDARPPLGLHLLMGDKAPIKLGNLYTNLCEDKLRVIQAIMLKPE